MSVLDQKAREISRPLLEAVAQGLARWNISPDWVTYLGLVLTFGVGALAALGEIRWAGVVYIVAAACDAVDGTLARVGGKGSRFGAFLDSTIDRFEESIVFVGLIVYYAQVGGLVEIPLILVAAVGSLMVSYTRSRAESLGVTCQVGFMTRVPRVGIMILGLLVDQVLIALIVLAVTSLLTAFHRMFHVWRQTDGEAGGWDLPQEPFASVGFEVVKDKEKRRDRLKYLNILLIFGVVAIVAEFLHGSPVLIFVASGLAMIPLAGLMGEATESLAVHTGPRLGGLLNATLGNSAELIITILAIREGVVNPSVADQMLELVRASLTGSVLGNILLVLGLSVLLGGLKHGTQRFERRHAGLNATMLMLAVAALIIPSIFSHSIELVDHDAVEYLSLGVAGVMIGLYVLSLIYQLRNPSAHTYEDDEYEVAVEEAPHWTVRKAVIVLAVATAAIVWMSEILVGSVEHVVAEIGITEFFLGIIIIPLIGNVAEHLVAVQVAVKNKMELSLAISVGSSLQIALFVAPLLVFVSLLMGNPLTLVFNEFELIAMMVAVLIAGLASLDGESNWLEGAMLLALYIIIALAFFWLPT